MGQHANGGLAVVAEGFDDAVVLNAVRLIGLERSHQLRIYADRHSLSRGNFIITTVKWLTLFPYIQVEARHLLSCHCLAKESCGHPRKLTLDITQHFGAKLAKRRRGGLILAGALGAENGVPGM